MSDPGKETCLPPDDAVEAILGQATRRPVPPEAEARAIRDAVHAEWRRVTGRRRLRTQLVSLAMAASVLVAVFTVLNMYRINGVEDVQVAAIEKSFGAIFVRGDNAELLEADHLKSVVAGQMLITDNDSGMALAWAEGGSLRIDANTRVEFLSPERIYLRSGRVYFDSAPALVTAGFVSGSDARLTIETDFGEVSHLGTQYMAHADASRLTVSVRDGEVMVRSGGSTDTASRHQQLAISGSGAHSIVNIGPHGAAWQWVEQTSPPVRLDGRSLSEFLGWVSHETGLSLVYESAAAESRANEERLNGMLDIGPRQALDAWMPGTDLEWRISEEVIYVDLAP